VFQLSISEGISMSDDSYIESDYDASERSDGNSIITDSDVDHTPSNSSDNNVSFNKSAFLRPVSEPVSVQSFSSDSESEESNWEENIFGDIEDFNFDSNSAGVKVYINDDSSPIDVFFKIGDNDIFDLVLTCTNNCKKKNSLNRSHTKNRRMKNVSPLTRTDLEKFFGLCLLRGQLKLPVLRNAFSSKFLIPYTIIQFLMQQCQVESLKTF